MREASFYKKLLFFYLKKPNILKIVFASGNENKVSEIRDILPKTIEVLSLSDIGCNEEIPETGATLEENSVIKARYVKEKFNLDCFADDTGLVVPALNGEPGVLSARYAGVQKNNENNINKLLGNLSPRYEREAYFETSIALILGSKTKIFTGKCKGKIAMARSGTNGFGYDSIFIPVGSERSFAEMSAEEKNAISHRKIAVEKLLTFLKNQTIDSQ